METYQISMRDHVQVRQDPGSSCSGAGEGTAPFYSDGPLRAVVQSYCLGCDEQAAATRAS